MLVMIPDLDDPGPQVSFSLDTLPARIGRHEDAEIRVTDQWVSRFHCEIDEADGLIRVRDLDSKHGVFVNGSRVTDARLESGDTLTVGMTSFRIESASDTIPDSERIASRSQAAVE